MLGWVLCSGGSPGYSQVLAGATLHRRLTWGRATSQLPEAEGRILSYNQEDGPCFIAAAGLGLSGVEATQFLVI